MCIHRTEEHTTVTLSVHLIELVYKYISGGVVALPILIYIRGCGSTPYIDIYIRGCGSTLYIDIYQGGVSIPYIDIYQGVW